MCKSDIFQHLLRITSEVTETEPDRIIGNHTDMESTDARFILATLLYERGFYPSQIAVWLNRKPRSIRALLVRGITSPMVGIMLEKLRKRSGNEDW